MSNRFRELLSSTPPVTLGIITLCCSVYVLQKIMDLDLDRFTLCPRMIFYLHEYYRILTSTVFHGSLMHIGMNMMSAFHLSMYLEKHMGTIPHLVTTLGAILMTSTIYLSVCWIASTLFASDTLLYQQSVGFSGVLFHFLVLECNLAASPSRSLFGVIQVPNYIYPWVLLVGLQFFLPNLSFLGHLSGILTGTLQYYGMLDLITVGSSLDTISACRWLVALPGFVRAPVDGMHASFQDPWALGHFIRGGAHAFANFAVNAGQTLWVCMFGRTSGSNPSIHIWRRWSSTQEMSELSGGHILGSTLEDDEEWVGLPTMAQLEKEPLTSRVV